MPKAKTRHPAGPRRAWRRGVLGAAAWAALAAAPLGTHARPAGAQEPAAGDTLAVEKVVAAGWEAARSDHHAEAAAHFRRAIEREPARRRELLPELAVRMTFSGEAEAAVPLYREAIGWDLPPEEALRMRRHLALSLSWSRRFDEALAEYGALAAADPGDVEARLGLARVLSWTGRLGPAEREYRAVLALDPAQREARRGVAQVRGWSGRPREARKLIEAYLREHPDDAEARYVLAEGLAGMGRPDRARAVLAGNLAAHPEHRPSADLLATLRLRSRPESRADLQRTRRSDNLTYLTLTTAQGVRLNGGLTTVEAQFQRLDYDPRSGPGVDVEVNRPGLLVRHRLGDAAEATAAPYLVSIDPGAAEGRDLLGWDARLALWAGDALRAELAMTRAPFYDDVLSLVPGIHLTSGGGAVDFVPDIATRASLRGSWGRVSDGNRRAWLQGEAERRVLPRPVVLLGGQLSTIRFAERRENGYFSPEDYRSALGTAKVFGNVGDRFYW
ncbi:MAG TPA: tetratricopeptide repeat protein, partial [Longimicrobiaceae bacterium]|nr:tetratricopeptide repeat protein [Longimicrobiaceae bacterium]